MNKLKVLRAEKDLTQSNLAELCGLSRATIISIEKNRAVPKPTTKNKIATALGINVKKIFGD